MSKTPLDLEREGLAETPTCACGREPSFSSVLVVFDAGQSLARPH